jgi:hypothetical protein
VKVTDGPATKFCGPLTLSRRARERDAKINRSTESLVSGDVGLNEWCGLAHGYECNRWRTVRGIESQSEGYKVAGMSG